MACIHTQGLLIPFFCLLIKWIKYAKFTGQSSKEAILYVFFLSFLAYIPPFLLFFSWKLLLAEKESLLFRKSGV